jgi:hypothetical protein
MRTRARARTYRSSRDGRRGGLVSQPPARRPGEKNGLSRPTPAKPEPSCAAEHDRSTRLPMRPLADRPEAGHRGAPISLTVKFLVFEGSARGGSGPGRPVCARARHARDALRATRSLRATREGARAHACVRARARVSRGTWLNQHGASAGCCTVPDRSPAYSEYMALRVLLSSTQGTRRCSGVQSGTRRYSAGPGGTHEYSERSMCAEQPSGRTRRAPNNRDTRRDY